MSIISDIHIFFLFTADYSAFPYKTNGIRHYSFLDRRLFLIYDWKMIVLIKDGGYNKGIRRVVWNTIIPIQVPIAG